MATILAAGTAAGTSSDVTLADGASANFVAYAASGVAPEGLRLKVMADTAGEDTAVGVLEPSNPDKAGLKVSGPGTFRVVRPPCSVSIGVDSL